VFAAYERAWSLVDHDVGGSNPDGTRSKLSEDKAIAVALLGCRQNEERLDRHSQIRLRSGGVKRLKAPRADLGAPMGGIGRGVPGHPSPIRSLIEIYGLRS
jgi:hypothetical protein